MSLLNELPLASYQNQKLAGLVPSESYDFATAGGMAWLSQLAYETAHPDKIDKVLGGWGLTRITLLKNPISGILPLVETRGLVVEGWNATIVAFAGTDPLSAANWLTNFDALPSTDDLHTGFENAVKSVWRDLRAATMVRDGQRRRLFVTGHSLGGALAVIAAEFLARDELADVIGVYTFGMPRCGGRRFADEYGDGLGPRTYRLVYGDDIVPTVPPPEFGFHHVGCLLCCRHGVAFDRLGRPTSTPVDLPPFAGTVLQGIRDLLHIAVAAELPAATQPGALGQAFRLLPPGIADHIPSAYLGALGFILGQKAHPCEIVR